jgi:hypothetical protein
MLNVSEKLAKKDRFVEEVLENITMVQILKEPLGKYFLIYTGPPIMLTSIM